MIEINHPIIYQVLGGPLYCMKQLASCELLCFSQWLQPANQPGWSLSTSLANVPKKKTLENAFLTGFLAECPPKKNGQIFFKNKKPTKSVIWFIWWLFGHVFFGIKKKTPVFTSYENGTSGSCRNHPGSLSWIWSLWPSSYWRCHGNFGEKVTQR